jgi:hypothetical protein
MRSLAILMILLMPVCAFAQDLTGLWIGSIYNDSTGVSLYYEIAISERKEKLNGYSYTKFIVDAKELTGVKSMKVTQRNGKVYLEANDLIYDDYPFEPPKGVKQLTVLELDATGNILCGKFTTSRTRQYGKPVTGTVCVNRQTNADLSKLIPVLTSLDLAGGLSFWKEDPLVAKSTPVETAKPIVTTPVKELPAAGKEESKPVVKAPTVTPPVEKSQPIVAPPVITPADEGKGKSKTVSAPVMSVEKPSIPIAEKEIEKREIETIQTVFFSADSLILELYDNGYVDGDSVSILLNGKSLVSHLRLTEKAFTKTIHITPGTGDSLKLVMFAENLGSIAPNSGLAIIRDGKNMHRITFSGDLRKNAAIILKKKR